MKKLLLAILLVPALSWAQITPLKKGTVPPTAWYSTIPLCYAGEGVTAKPLTCDANGSLKTAAQYAEDSAHTTGDIGTAILTRRIDVPASSAGTSGDYATLNTNSQGRLYVNLASEINEDGTHTDGDAGIPTWSIAKASPAGTAGTANDYAGIISNLTTGGLYVEPIGHTVTVCDSTAVSDAAYAPGDCVGNGTAGACTRTFANMFRSPMYSGTIVRVSVFDAAAQAVGYTFHPLTAALTTSTATDQNAFALTAEDFAKKVPGIPLNSSNSFTTLETWATDPRPVASSDTSLRGVLVTSGAPDYVATSDVTVCVTAYQD